MTDAPACVIAGSIFDGERLYEDHAVVVRGDTVAGLAPRPAVLARNLGAPVELDGEVLVPGFVDLQVNGGGGALFNDAPSVETIAAIGAAHARFGTVGFLPTLITASAARMREAIDAADAAIDARVPGVLGIHLEGPYINPERRGVHDAAHIREPSEAGIERLMSAKRGVTLVTLAPESTGTAMIARLARAGVVVCAGHSAADYDTVLGAIGAGLSGFTHLYNAMPPLLSRNPGPVGAALATDDTWYGIIADGHHVHPAALRTAVRAKRAGGAVLVTDAMPVVGASLEAFTLGGATVRVVGGRCVTEAGGLAGSSLTMIEAVNNTVRFAGVDFFEAVRMASLYPAAAVGLDDRLGRIRPGCRASFVAVDTERRVTRVWIDGVRRVG